MSGSTCLTLYKTIIGSLFDYCDIIYDGMSKKDSDRLQRLQNSCCWIILRRGKLSNVEEIHRELSLDFLALR